jgi:hypothetical protein
MLSEALSIDMLMEDLQRTADWRLQKAEEFPHDTRNRAAADSLQQLANQIRILSGGDLDQQLASLSNASLASGRADALITAQSQPLREVGFHWAGNAADFMKALIGRFEREVEIGNAPE